MLSRSDFFQYSQNHRQYIQTDLSPINTLAHINEAIFSSWFTESNILLHRGTISLAM